MRVSRGELALYLLEKLYVIAMHAQALGHLIRRSTRCWNEAKRNSAEISEGDCAPGLVDPGSITCR